MIRRKYVKLPTDIVKSLLAFILVLSICPSAFAQNRWVHLAGGSQTDYGSSIAIMLDGGPVIAGYSDSKDGDLMGLDKGLCDIVVIKLDRDGNTLWQKAYGGAGRDYVSSIVATADGGFVLTGATDSRDGDFASNVRRGHDIVVAKFDIYGRMQWHTRLGGSEYESGVGIVTTSDGGFVFVGQSFSNNVDLKGSNKGDMDIVVAKLDRGGNLVWLRSIGGSSADAATAVSNTINGGFAVTGWTISEDGDFPHQSRGGRDMFVTLLDSNGNVTWTKTYGGSLDDEGASITTASDGGIVVSGSTASNDFHFKGLQKGGGDIFALKIDDHGSIKWIRTYGGSSTDEGRSIFATAEGGFIIAGASDSRDGLFNDLGQGDVDVCIFKIDRNGAVVWKNLVGGTSNDEGQAVFVTPDGGCVVTGSTSSNDGYFEGLGKGGEDLFIIKLDRDGRSRQ